MENYKLINMFNQLDASILEDLHLEKDLKRQQHKLNRIIANGNVRIASLIAGIGLFVVGILVFLGFIMSKASKARL